VKDVPKIEAELGQGVEMREAVSAQRVSRRVRVGWAVVAGALLCNLSALVGEAAAESVSQTFSNPANAGTTGTFTVPAGVTVVHVVAVGGKGGDRTHVGFGPGGVGGFGGVVSGDLPVLPGQVLRIYVGGNGENEQSFETAAAGGFNGGGESGSSASLGSGGAGGGGGASDVRITGALGTRLLVAAGGGGASNNNNGGATPNSGNGGSAGQPGTAPNAEKVTEAGPGVANADGTGSGGKGGTGFSGKNGAAGALGVGGAGGYDSAYDGGGGGGGLYGGGGGAASYGQPGAGGASWVTPLAINPTMGIDNTGAPRVTISYTLPSSAAPGTPSPPATGYSPGQTPSITSLALSPSVFRAAPGGASIAAKSRVPTGTTVSYVDSVAAMTTFSVLQLQPGVRSGKQCVKPRRKRGHTRHCTRTVVLGSFSHSDLVAANRFRFTGRVAGHKLRPGNYLLQAIPQANQKNGQARTVRFRIVG
jgi:hypothetical protein